MSKFYKTFYSEIIESMLRHIRFLEDELYNRAYKDIERQEVEIERLKAKCVDLMLENADYVWDEMARQSLSKKSNKVRFNWR